MATPEDRRRAIPAPFTSPAVVPGATGTFQYPENPVGKGIKAAFSAAQDVGRHFKQPVDYAALQVARGMNGIGRANEGFIDRARAAKGLPPMAFAREQQTLNQPFTPAERTAALPRGKNETSSLTAPTPGPKKKPAPESAPAATPYTRQAMPNGDQIVRYPGNEFVGVGSGQEYAPTGVNFAEANKQFEAANAERQKMIDLLSKYDTRHGAIMTDGSGDRGNSAQIQRLIGEMMSGKQSGHRTAIDALLAQDQMNSVADTDRYRTDTAANSARFNDQTQMQIAQQGQGPSFTELLNAQMQGAKFDREGRWRQEDATLANDEVTREAVTTRLGALSSAIKSLTDEKGDTTTSAERRTQIDLQLPALYDEQRNLSAGMLGERTKEYAHGGLVEGYAMGGAIPAVPYGGTPDAGALDSAMKQYGQYAATAAANGVHPLDVGEYVDLLMEGQQMLQQHPGMTEGYATGGAIPVAGQQVMDPAMGGMDMEGTDSIPAVIDGQRPAALTSGEYVIPAEVVAAKGTEFFDRLVSKYINSEE